MDLKRMLKDTEEIVDLTGVVDALPSAKEIGQEIKRLGQRKRFLQRIYNMARDAEDMRNGVVKDEVKARRESR
jgi:hypothetical protein